MSMIVILIQNETGQLHHFEIQDQIPKDYRVLFYKTFFLENAVTFFI